MIRGKYCSGFPFPTEDLCTVISLLAFDKPMTYPQGSGFALCTVCSASLCQTNDYLQGSRGPYLVRDCKQLAPISRSRSPIHHPGTRWVGDKYPGYMIQPHITPSWSIINDN